ncbi:MAG TPA: hydantoinase B/oxoprolinase family protein [Candidatus Competibacteraceae bacterium]|nr:hydantoinase B/oxoprolinase family protein [Candidatus Competibacteraceae bacterium]HQD57562.1 hydantoinase B/oxoprolinase family protein [Candidatus Competibacteraceae bacterium]
MTASLPSTARWQFWIDRGGTFTDIVAQRPDGQLLTHKLLSVNPEHYPDAALQGIRDLLGVAPDQPIPAERIAAVKMGTTVATNALLERKGDRTLLLISHGFRDALRIAYQNRPQLFARHIVLPELLYERVAEVRERVSAQGEVIVPFDPDSARAALEQAHAAGIHAVAIVFLHGYRYPDHERQAAALAQAIGFTQISVSHQVSPLMKLVGRGDTTVVDAYLSPILRRYIDRLGVELADTRLLFMQSNGGLADARHFQGKDSILSGPAGGIVGAVRTAAQAGFDRIITFDMGGTSTDVAHYAGEYERAFETLVAGVRLRAPMLHIHTVAAGGGSICRFDGSRLRVGPESAGASPGPACYRRGGPLTVTDCNVLLGRIQPAFFPLVFGPERNQPLDRASVVQKFAALAVEVQAATGQALTPMALAEGFLTIAVENMTRAIKQISTQRGYDVTEYTLCCFGGAGGQHACAVADALGMSTLFIHPFAGVLSAYGMGLADARRVREQALEIPLDPAAAPLIAQVLAELDQAARAEMAAQDIPAAGIDTVHSLRLRYAGSDSALSVAAGTATELHDRFTCAHQQRYGFVMPDKSLIVEAATVEAIGAGFGLDQAVTARPARTAPLQPVARFPLYIGGSETTAPFYRRTELYPGDCINGPAIIGEAGATTLIEPGWRAVVTARNDLTLTRYLPRPRQVAVGTQVDPILLEVFNNLFMAIAEQMGVTLANTAHSVNIKERMDFSCALFDHDGQLIANAPHIPVHLGSMGEAVQALIQAQHGQFQPGDAYASNAPYHGGTHLPDITVITPVFDAVGAELLFYVASRGHHADIGGITPGSMPPDSVTMAQEGVLLDNFPLLHGGRLRERELLEQLGAGPWPARNPPQNLADLQAQLAANEKGVQELQRMVAHFGLTTVRAYMQHVQDNAAEQVRRTLDRLQDGQFSCEMDNGAVIRVAIALNRAARSARIDFTGTSAQLASNFNAPRAVCLAAVLYVFRTLVDDDIPLNAGCLRPLDIVIPAGSLLDPRPPAAVVAGNVETSQAVVDALYGALGVMAASQGTMNNFTFGNARHQYYETLCGGSGAGPGFDGASAVQTHMTNSRLTDPEVLEWRFPVRVEEFRIRSGSGGAGRWRGGDGAIRRIRFLEPMTAAILSGRRRIPPYGLQGGEPGQTGRNAVERAQGATEELPGTAQAAMQAGDVFVIETPGGGGYREG